jgi:hypothetical protein
MAIAQSVAQCTICTSMSGLAGRLGHADAVARPAQGDQQARHPNAAPHHRLRGCAEDRTKKPRQGAGQAASVRARGTLSRTIPNELL